MTTTPHTEARCRRCGAYHRLPEHVYGHEYDPLGRMENAIDPLLRDTETTEVTVLLALRELSKEQDRINARLDRLENPDA